MSWQFLLFLTITLIRQIPHLAMEAVNRPKIKRSKGRGLTLTMYVLYLFIWLSTLYFIFRTPPDFSWLPVLGLFLLVAGIGLRFLSLATLGRYFASSIVIQEKHKLIKTGPYGVIRHPLYSAMILELGGMIGFSGTAFLFPFLVVAVLVFKKQAKEEDKILRGEFGRESELYQKEVGAFIPRFPWRP